jgi:hypothetical protein
MSLFKLFKGFLGGYSLIGYFGPSDGSRLSTAGTIPVMDSLLAGLTH